MVSVFYYHFFKTLPEKKCKIVLFKKKIISSSLPRPSLLPLPSLPASSLPPSLLLPFEIHLLPERVISSLNLSINKYFGRNAVFKHRIIPNHHFFGRKMTAFYQILINKAFYHEMRNCPYHARNCLNQNIWAIYISQNSGFYTMGERMYRRCKITFFLGVPA